MKWLTYCTECGKEAATIETRGDWEKLSCNACGYRAVAEGNDISTYYDKGISLTAPAYFEDKDSGEQIK
jgi:DNA-directed RNA polymerase subunit RPC12/RpoP